MYNMIDCCGPSKNKNKGHFKIFTIQIKSDFVGFCRTLYVKNCILPSINIQIVFYLCNQKALTKVDIRTFRLTNLFLWRG